MGYTGGLLQIATVGLVKRTPAAYLLLKLKIGSFNLPEIIPNFAFHLPQAP